MTSITSGVYADNVDVAVNYYNEALDFYKQDNTEESIRLFKKATEANPEFYEAYYNLAQILMSLNKDEETYDALSHVVKIKPEDTESLYNIGKIQYKRGYLTSSANYLKKIPSTAPQYESAKLLLAKIDKRHKELALENLIKEHKNVVDTSGKTKGVNIIEVEAPSGVAVDTKGNIYSASFSQDTIYKLSTIGQKSAFAKSTNIKGPIGLAVDKNNNIYVANYNANNILKITSAGAISVFADVQKPYCLIYDSLHDRLYVTEQNTNKIVKFDL